MLSISTDAKTDSAIKGLRKLSWAFKKSTRDTFLDVDTYIQKKAKEMMTSPKSGREYRVYVSRNGGRIRRGRIHKASAQNEPFAMMSGATLRSLRRIVPRWSKMEVGFGTVQGAVWDKTGRSVLQNILYSREFERVLEKLHTQNMKRNLGA